MLDLQQTDADFATEHLTGPKKRSKVCTKCKEKKFLSEFYYHRARKYFMSACKKCNTQVCGGYQNKRRHGPDSYKQLLAERAANIKRDSRKDVPVMPGLRLHLISLWETQKGLCFYTGRKMQTAGYHVGVREAMTIDRKVPEKGYVEGNVVLCCSFINRMKQNFTLSELLGYCKELLEIHGEV